MFFINCLPTDFKKALVLALKIDLKAYGRNKG